jgi:hypothetical protein
MNDFNFGLDDLEIETTGSTFGRFILYAMLLIFAAASMITTYAFFAVYAPGLGEALHPGYGAIIAGVLGVVLFDLAGLGWTVLRARNSDTTRQFVIATAAAVVTIFLALLTSGLQVLLSTSFDVGLYLADGSLSEFGRTMQLTGVVVMTLGFVLNFAAIAAYVNSSKDITAATQNTQLRAYVTAGRFAADRARAQLVTERTLSGIMQQLPQLATRAGSENTTNYVNRAFTGRAQTVIDQADYDDVEETYEDLDALVEALVNERLRERERERLAAIRNGQAGTNFPQRPGSGRGSL